MTTEKADMVFASLPYRIMHKFQTPLYDQKKQRDAGFDAEPKAPMLPVFIEAVAWG